MEKNINQSHGITIITLSHKSVLKPFLLLTDHNLLFEQVMEMYVYKLLFLKVSIDSLFKHE